MQHVHRIIGRLTPSTGSVYAGQVAQHAPDRWLKQRRTGSAAPEYSARPGDQLISVIRAIQI